VSCAWVGDYFVPPHPNPLPEDPEERESIGTVREISQIAVAVPASFSLVSRQPSSDVLSQRGGMFPPLLGERVGVRGNGTPAVLAISALDLAPERPYVFEPFII